MRLPLSVRQVYRGPLSTSLAEQPLLARLLSRPDVGYIGPGTVAITVVDDSTFIFRSSLISPVDDYRSYIVGS